MRPNPRTIELAHRSISFPSRTRWVWFASNESSGSVCLDRGTTETHCFFDVSSSNRRLSLPRSRTSSGLRLCNKKINLRQCHSFCSTNGTYGDVGRLSSTTTFITFDVTDLYTMIPRDDHRHLDENGPFSLGYELFRLRCRVLSTDSRWSDGITVHNDSGEYLYVTLGATVDRTSDLLLDEANNRDENIRITRSTSTVVQFLDVSMENKYKYVTLALSRQMYGDIRWCREVRVL